jgi:hypothetical protein
VYDVAAERTKPLSSTSCPAEPVFVSMNRHPRPGHAVVAGKPQQPVVKVGRMRERGIFGQIKAENRRNIRDLARFSNADLAEKARSERDASFATGCQAWFKHTE